jgi:DNA replication protein DnaC
MTARDGNHSTLSTSLVPVNYWHEVIGNPTLDDAILDRLIHSAYQITLKRKSMQKRLAKSTPPSPSE